LPKNNLFTCTFFAPVYVENLVLGTTEMSLTHWGILLCCMYLWLQCD